MAAGQHGGSGVTLRTFNWTEKRDALLAELRRAGLSLKETATAIGCEVEHVKLRARELGIVATPRVPKTTHQLATVPRPAGVMSRSDAAKYPGVAGTAREAPSGSSSGEPMRASGTIPPRGAVVTGRSPAARTRPLIDLSSAPSSMERLAEKWAGRA